MAQHNVSGKVRADGSWTRFGVVRETDNGGSIDFDPGVTAGSPFCMRLRNALDGTLFTDEISWCNESGRKTLATNVIAGTRFTIDARGSDGKTDFNGKLFTA